MTGDIRNNIKIIQYPKTEKFEDLSDQEIIKYINNHKDYINKFEENQDYYIGKNTTITTKKEVDRDNPDSRISVSYSRTMTSVVKGYMYKPNNITYTCEDEIYLEKLEEIFEANNEPLKTSENGEAQSKFGIGVEVLYTDKLNPDDYLNNETIPYFCNVNPKEVVLVYSMNMYEKLIGAIRFYVIEKNEKLNIKKYKVEVYYKLKVVEYEMIEDAAGQKELTVLQEYPNYFNDIPFVTYKNNNECHADYEPIKPLIDAYDVMMSDAVNEIQRFANAYLIIKNYIPFNEEDGAEREKVMETLKSKRLLQFMDSTGTAEFLTRSIPSDFFNVVKMTLREDIQYHSHIPDFRSKNFENASGKSILYSLFDFENLCADKQALFEVGLRRRIELINNFLRIKAVDIDKVNIKFVRNLPIDLQEKVTSFVQLAGTNKIADEDLLAILPKEIIPDIGKAIERINKQKEEEMNMFNLDTATVNMNQNNNLNDQGNNQNANT